MVFLNTAKTQVSSGCRNGVHFAGTSTARQPLSRIARATGAARCGGAISITSTMVRCGHFRASTATLKECRNFSITSTVTQDDCSHQICKLLPVSFASAAMAAKTRLDRWCWFPRTICGRRWLRLVSDDTHDMSVMAPLHAASVAF